MGKVYKTVYRCEYVLDITPKLTLYARSEVGLEAFVSGFWVDDDYNFGTTNPVKYWVPPHCIKYISKDRVRKS